MIWFRWLLDEMNIRHHSEKPTVPPAARRRCGRSRSAPVLGRSKVERSNGMEEHRSSGSSNVAAAGDGRTLHQFAQNENPSMKWEYMTLMLPATGLILGGKI